MPRFGIYLACLLTLFACDDGDGDGPSDPSLDATMMDMGADVAVDAGPALPDPPAAGEWIEISPGGDTICSRGTPYSFYVRGGRPDRVIVDFQGGGACWDDFTCSVADALFSDSVGGLERFLSFSDQAAGSFFDPDPSNPFADWTLIHVPYCSGDIHWGDATVEYDGDLTIHHRGFVNARSALDWIETHFAGPEKIFVSGCSAGAYGAILHSAFLAQHYADSQVAVLADSGAGIITDSFLNDSLPNWNAQANIPSFVDGLDVPINQLTLPDLYINIARQFPQHRFAQTAAAYDADQIFFYGAMGGDRHAWPTQFQSSLTRIESEVPNFRAYVPPGSMHCATPYPFFSTRTVNGVKLVDWAVDLVDAPAMPDSVKCEGEACFDDPVCASCAEGGASVGANFCRFCEGWPERFRPPEE